MDTAVTLAVWGERQRALKRDSVVGSAKTLTQAHVNLTSYTQAKQNAPEKSVMLQIIVIVISFILTIVIGGKIAQARQQDSWIAQQRFSGEEKEYFELKELCDEVASSLGTRIYAMRRLTLQLIAYVRHAKFDQSAVEDYRVAVKSWNENVNSYYVRFSQLGLGRFRYRLESELHDPMRKQGDLIDNAIYKKEEKSGHVDGLRSVVVELNRINAASLDFNKSLLQDVHNKRVKIYFPKRIIFSRDTMSTFSTWILIKAIFVVDVNRISVVRSPLDS